MYITEGTEGSINRIMDEKGNVLSVNNYEEMYAFGDDGVAPFLKDGLWGYIDKHGRILMEPQFELAGPFSGGIAIVEIEGKKGIINKQGKLILELKNSERIEYYRDGMAIIEDKLQYIYIDQFGKKVFEIDKKEVKQILEFNYEDRCSTIFLLSGKTICINEKGEEVEYINPNKVTSEFKKKINFELMDDCFQDNMVLFKSGGKYGCLNREGEVIIKPEYEMMFYFNEGLASICKKGKYGVIDKKGKEVIPQIYDDIGFFCEGISYFILNGKYGYMNRNGEIVVQSVYERASDFVGGIAIIKENGKEGLINKNGEIVVEPIYDHISPDRKCRLYMVTLNNKLGFIDNTGKVVIDIIYDYLSFFQEVED